MRPPIKWHGGKYYQTETLLSLTPEHTHYVETHAGGLNMLWAKDPHGISEVINDLNHHLTNFYKILRCEQRFPVFQQAIELTPFSRHEFDQTFSQGISDSIGHAVQFFIQNRMSRQGLGKDFATLSKTRTRRGMNEQVSSYLSSIEGLPEIHERLRRVVIECDHAPHVIKREDSEHTFFYCDPPYPHWVRSSTNEYGEWEMSEEEHVELLETLSAIRGKFLLSTYPNDLYWDYAAENGWWYVDLEIDNKASSGKTKRKMTERIFGNYHE